MTRQIGIDPVEDRLRIRALRAVPTGRAATDDDRRRVFAAALGQFDELLDAAASVGPASRPLPLYYALNQAGRAVAAALQQDDRPWQPRLHGLRIEGPGEHGLQYTKISPQRTSDASPGSFQLLAEAIHAPLLTGETMLMNVWAAIPDLDKPGLGAGCPHALPLEVDSRSPNPVYAWVRHLDWLPAHDEAKPRLQQFLAATYPRNGKALVVTAIAHDEAHGMAAAKAELTWKNEDGVSLGPYSVADRYLWPTSLWLVPALSSGDVLPPLLLWWCLLQALSSLARYHPAEWTAALDPDRSRWAVSIERALSTALAVVPRLVLVTLSPGAIHL